MSAKGSPSFANLFKANFKKKAKNNLEIELLLYLRYVDNEFLYCDLCDYRKYYMDETTELGSSLRSINLFNEHGWYGYMSNMYQKITATYIEMRYLSVYFETKMYLIN